MEHRNSSKQWRIQGSQSISIATENGNTMVHTATRADNIECVRLLVNWGADVTIPNYEGDTPLHTALRTFRVGTSTRTHFRNRALLPLLLNNDIIKKGENEEGIKPLIIAAINKDLHAVRWLIRNGSNVHQEAVEGAAPHYAATYDSNSSVIKFLIEKGAQLDSKGNKEGRHH